MLSLSGFKLVVFERDVSRRTSREGVIRLMLSASSWANCEAMNVSRNDQRAWEKHFDDFLLIPFLFQDIALRSLDDMAAMSSGCCMRCGGLGDAR